MSVKKYSLSALVQCALVVCLYAQQAPQISHYMFNPQMYNPASAGFSNSIIASGIHRQQWYGFDGAPQTTKVSFDAPLRVISSGLGLNIANDQIGFYNNTHIQLAYNYQLPFLAGTLGIGIQGGMNNLGLKSDFKPERQGDPTLTSIGSDVSRFLFDVGAGLFYQVPDQYEIGVSMQGINEPVLDKEVPVQGGYKQKRWLNFSGNYQFSLDMVPNVNFVPSMLFKSNENW